MPDSREKLWSDSPNAPKISYPLYFREKSSFAGSLIGTILYGVVIVLFFKCMAALFNPVYRRGEGVRWGLVSYTVVMFSFVTVLTAMNLDILSISYIDNREFPGAEDLSPPGPLGHGWLINPSALSIVPHVMLALCILLSDGLLFYRCYIIYSKNLWVIAFPCLMYLVSVALGIVTIYQIAHLINSDSILPYFSIALSLNVLLTLMIVVRLILHTRNVPTAAGKIRISGLYKAIIAMLIESCAIYAVNSLLFIGLQGAHNYAKNIFLSILPETQVIAFLLIIQRVADKSAFTGDIIVSAHFDEFKVRSGGQLTAGSGTLPGEDSVCFANRNGENSGEFGAMIDFH